MQRVRLALLAAVVHVPAVAAVDDRALVLIHAGFGTPKGFVLRGRVVEDEGIRPPDERRGRLANVVDTVKAFETDELVGVRVAVAIDGRTWNATTDRDGVWRIDAAGLKKPLPVGAVPVTVRAVGDIIREVEGADNRASRFGGATLVRDFAAEVELVAKQVAAKP